jgi:uncharacterized DUF497 family protein
MSFSPFLWYDSGVDVDFDPEKDARNLEKHGVSLGLAAYFCWGSAFYQQDIRKDYGEQRFYSLGILQGRLHAMIFTPRNGKARIISLRKANTREITVYEIHQRR